MFSYEDNMVSSIVPKGCLYWKIPQSMLNCVFSHDVMAAIFGSQNNEMAAMFVSQASPVGVELVSHVNAFFCSNKFA